MDTIIHYWQDSQVFPPARKDKIQKIRSPLWESNFEEWLEDNQQNNTRLPYGGMTLAEKLRQENEALEDRALAIYG